MATERMIRCIELYAQTGDMRQAAIDAGYSERYAERMAQKLDKIDQAPPSRPAEYMQKMAIAKLFNIAMSSIDEIMDGWENHKPFEEIPRGAMDSIREIDVTTSPKGDKTISFRRESSLQAIKLLFEVIPKAASESQNFAPQINIQYNGGAILPFALNDEQTDDEDE